MFGTEIRVPLWVIVVLAIIVIYHLCGWHKKVTEKLETFITPFNNARTQADVVEFALRQNMFAGR